MLSTAIIDRTIFELLRLGVVERGKLPDWRAMVGATIQDRQTAYEAAKDAFRANTQLIEVFSIGSAVARGEKTTNRITIARKGQSIGTLGATGLYGFEKASGTTFNKYAFPDSTFHLDYEIRIICTDTEFERIMQDCIVTQLGTRRFLTSVDDLWNFTLQPFETVFTGSVNVSTPDYIEWIFNYKVMDVFISQHDLIAHPLPRLSTISFDTYISTIDDPNLNTPTGTIIVN
jgi:hypothetical protein